MVVVIKRDGSNQPFDINKIVNAILSAQEKIGKSDFDQALQVSLQVQDKVIHHESITIPEMHEVVEYTLMENNLFPVAREYIAYRSHRDTLRGLGGQDA